MEFGYYFLAVLVVLIPLLYVMLTRRKSDFKRVVKKISSEYKKNVVIPDGLDGFIELEHLTLSPHGLLVIDYRDIQGTIFPGEHLEQWPIMHNGRRTSITNPYAGLKNRVTAVRSLVTDIPLHGLLVFPDDVTFGNTPPENVIHVSDLYSQFNYKNLANKEQLISSFKQGFNEVVTYIDRLN